MCVVLAPPRGEGMHHCVPRHTRFLHHSQRLDIASSMSRQRDMYHWFVLAASKAGAPCARRLCFMPITLVQHPAY